MLLVFGSPTTGKTYLSSQMRLYGVRCLDTDYPHTLWTDLGESVPDELKLYRTLKSTDPSSVKDLVRERIRSLTAYVIPGILVTNFNMKDIIYDIGFGRSSNDLVVEWSRRSGSASALDLANSNDGRLARWISDVDSVKSRCHQFTLLKAGQYMADQSDYIFELAIRKSM